MGQKVKFIEASVYASFVNSKLDRIEANAPESTKEASRQIRQASQGLLDLHPISLYYSSGLEPTAC